MLLTNRYRGVFAAAVACLTACELYAEPLDFGLVRKIQDGHSHLRSASANVSGVITRWRGPSRDSEDSMSVAGLSQNLSARFIVRDDSSRLEYSVPGDPGEMTAVLMRSAGGNFKYVANSSTGSPYATLFSYDSASHPEIASSFAADLDGPLFAMFSVAGVPVLEYLQGADVDVQKGSGGSDGLLLFTGSHQIEGSQVDFEIRLDPMRHYSVRSSRMTSVSGDVTSILTEECFSEFYDQFDSYLPTGRSLAVRTTVNAEQNDLMSYDEVWAVEVNKTLATETIDGSYFDSLGRNYTTVKVSTDDSMTLSNDMVTVAPLESPTGGVPPQRESRVWWAFLVFNGIIMVLIGSWVLVSRYRSSRSGSSQKDGSKS